MPRVDRQRAPYYAPYYEAGRDGMGTRTVRLDEEAEKTLARLRQVTGLSISEVLKQGLLSFETAALAQARRKPYDVYRTLDLGEGGYARVPAAQAKTGVAAAIRRKYGR